MSESFQLLKIFQTSLEHAISVDLKQWIFNENTFKSEEPLSKSVLNNRFYQMVLSQGTWMKS